ncbi:MAG: methyl-accepting chemotaxis protein [Burkholderiales bacterium]
MFLRKMRIGTRLAVGFGSILVFLMAVVVAVTFMGKSSRDELMAVLGAASAKEALAAEMKALALEQSSVMRNIGLHSDIKLMQQDEDRARALGKSFDEALRRMQVLAVQPDERAILDMLATVDGALNAPFRQAIGLSTSFRNEEAAQVLMGEVDPLIRTFLGELNNLIEIQKKANRAAVEEAIASGERRAAVAYAIVAVVLVLAALIAWAITRSITVPMGESVGVARRVAAGDLSARVKASGRDEAGELLRALAEMNDGLSRMVLQIRSGAESIAVGAQQVAAGNQSLSSRTEEHASSLEETASTLEEFTTTVKQNAEHAKQASELASSASTTAQRGGEVVSKVVTTMQEVTTSSKRISEIIGVIDGISFQTNILALNAAVEAARAGEQGRGFAVVASEVRSLAQRSAASAKEIRGLIETSVGKVEAGAKLVEQAGKTMDELVASVRRVAEIMTEIASASHEQSSGIEQINKAITQMDTVVQMNASLVEEATAAATSMANQAAGLARSVAQFRVADEAGEAPPAVLAAGPRGATLAAPAAVAPARVAQGARNEPLLADGDGEEWKEF